MTVSTSKRVKRHIGNGVTTKFPYDFYIPNEESLEVYLYDSNTGFNQLLNPSVYSVTGIGDDNFGEVTYPLSGSPITSTQTLTIRRVVKYDQNMSIRNQTGFFPEVIEDALDHLTFQTQQNAEDISRATVAPLEEETDMTLPSKTNRASKVAGWDSAGEWVALSQLDKSADTVTAIGTNTPRSLAEWMRNVQVQFATASALEANSGDLPPVVMVRGYASDGDGGDGIYHLDASDNTTSNETWDSIGRWTLVDGAGHRWKLQNPAGRALSFQQVGIRPGSSSYATANTARLNAFYASEARRLVAEAGTFHFDGTIANAKSNKELAGVGKYFTTFDFGNAPDFQYFISNGESFDDPLTGIVYRDFSTIQTGRAPTGIHAAIWMRNVKGGRVERVTVTEVKTIAFWAVDCDDLQATDLRAVTTDATEYAAGRGARVISWDGVSNSEATRCTAYQCAFGILITGNDEGGTKTFDAVTDIDPDTDTLTWTAHGLAIGDAVKVDAGGNTPPVGLEDGETYYLIVVDANTVKFAASPIDAIVGNAIDITADGSGTITLEYSINNSKSARPRADIVGVRVTACTIEKYTGLGIGVNAVDGHVVTGNTIIGAASASPPGLQNKHNSGDEARHNIFSDNVLIDPGIGIYSQDGSWAAFRNNTVRDPKNHAAWINSAPRTTIDGLIVRGLPTNAAAVLVQNAPDCMIESIASEIAPGATGTYGIRCINGDRAFIAKVNLANDHATGISIDANSDNVEIGSRVYVGGSPISDLSTTSKWPVTLQAVIDLSSAATTPMTFPPRGIVAARATAAISALSGGAPELSIGTTADPDFFVEQTTLSSLALGAINALTLANSLSGAQVVPTCTVNVAGSSGQAVVALFGLHRV